MGIEPTHDRFANGCVPISPAAHCPLYPRGKLPNLGRPVGLAPTDPCATSTGLDDFALGRHRETTGNCQRTSAAASAAADTPRDGRARKGERIKKPRGLAARGCLSRFCSLERLHLVNLAPGRLLSRACCPRADMAEIHAGWPPPQQPGYTGQHGRARRFPGADTGVQRAVDDRQAH